MAIKRMDISESSFGRFTSSRNWSRQCPLSPFFVPGAA